MSPYVLGIDGGGSSTVAWLADGEGTIVGRGTGGPSNAKSVGQETALKSLEQAARTARTNAGHDGGLAAACLGVAGFDRADDRAFLEAWGNGSLRAKKVIVVNDGELVLAAGAPPGLAVAVIAGTGSIAVGRDGQGGKARSGGWGHLFGDEGSGYRLVLDALTIVARRGDGREPAPVPDPLTARLCRAFGAGSPEQIVSFAYRPDCDRAKLASFAPEVLQAAREEPGLVDRLLRPAGESLAEMAAAVARKLGRDSGTLPLALAGSFLINAPAVVEALVSGLERRGWPARAEVVTDPVVGAVAIARAGAV